MTSGIRARVASKLNFTSSSNPESPADSSPPTPTAESDGASTPSDLANQKYLLRVTAGPSYDPATHHQVPVNAGPSPVFENDAVTASVRVRIKEYAGLPAGSPQDSPYFSNPSRSNDRYSVSFAFVPKRDLPAKDLVWGNDFDHPIRDRLPPGFNFAFKIVKDFIDPGLSVDAYADEPWLYGPALSCWFAFRVGEKVGEGDVKKFLESRPGGKDESSFVEEGGDGDGLTIRQNMSMPEDGQKRRKFFLDEKNRENFVFEKGRLYEGDFFNPYLDFNKFALRLPGFSLAVTKYTDNKTHQLRYVFKDRETKDLHFCVIFTLLFGEELKEALAKQTPQKKTSPETSSDDVD